MNEIKIQKAILFSKAMAKLLQVGLAKLTEKEIDIISDKFHWRACLPHIGDLTLSGKISVLTPFEDDIIQEYMKIFDDM